MDKKAVISMSGGMDSTSLAVYLLSEGYEVKAYAFNYGQKHVIELEKASACVNFLQSKGLPITLQIINLKDVFNESVSSLNSSNNEKVPEGHYEDEIMKSTVVENRNVIFSSIVYSKALSWSKRTNSPVVISLGIHKGDHCFTKDTQILTPKGLKTIETLKIGDDVYSMDLDTQEILVDTCVDIIHKGFNNQIYQIQTTSGKINLTGEHKVYVCDFTDYNKSKGYIKNIIEKKVKDLEIGDYMITLEEPDKYQPNITQITDINMLENEPEPVYDISIKNNHNFFAGEFGNVLISNSIYPDCTEESQQMARELFRISNWGSENVDYIAPFVNIPKDEVLHAGVDACKVLGIDWKDVYKNTISCYTPDEHGRSCGKCGTCVERIEAFEKMGLKDPIEYEN